MHVKAVVRVQRMSAGMSAGVIAVCLLLVGNPRAQETQEKVIVDDVDRTFVTRLPRGYDKEQHYPVVILLHGAHQDANDMERLTRFDELADKDGVIAVYPNSLHGRWNVGVPQGPPVTQRRGGYGRRPWPGGGYPGGGYPGGRYPRGGQGPGRPPQNRPQSADDVAFINQMLDKLSSEYSVDPSRIYAAGLSDGGFMAMRLGCTLSDRIAAIAPVGAAMPKTMICLPDRSISVAMINGTHDPIVRYDGSSGRTGIYPTLSVEDSAKAWAKIDRCVEKPSHSKVPEREKGGKETKVASYDGCPQGAQVVLYSVKGGGSTWPGGEQYEVEKTVGKTSHDIDANQIIWSFFVTKRLPAQAPPPAKEQGKERSEQPK
jgi:polyhydroxybutyrate depolymerase